ncbi:MAG: glycosyltransferase [Gordonia sp. (in: high G+C Gram-positive bacteria)]
MSIVVTNFNYGDYLEAAVLSALDQSGLDIEVIIADNGSTDHSLAVAKALTSADPRIQLHTQDQNIHPLVNFNAGIDLATGQYVQVLCADDILTTDSLTRAVAVMEARPDVVFTYGSCSPFENEPPEFTPIEVSSWTIWDGDEWVRGRYRAGTNPFFHPEVLMRTTTIREVGGYNPDFRLTSDLLLWMQAALCGNVARINGPDQAFYRQHGTNLHTQINGDGWMRDFEGRQQAFDSLPKLSPSSTVGATEIDESRRALAFDAVKYACMALSSTEPETRRLGADYATYAAEVWPSITSSLRWRTIASSINGDSRLWPRIWFKIDVKSQPLVTRLGRTSRYHREPLWESLRRSRHA